MSGSWVQNFFGKSTENSKVELEEDERSMLQDIRRPILELSLHVGFKMAELGSFVGCWFVTVPYNYYFGPKWEKPQRRQQMNIIRRNGWRYGFRTMWAFTAAAPIITLVYTKVIRQYSQDELWDRCFRLRLNRKALFMDRLFVAHCLIGFYWRRWQGVLLISQFGVLYGSVYTWLLWDRMGFHFAHRPRVGLPADYKYRPPAILDSLETLRANTNTNTIGNTGEFDQAETENAEFVY